MEAREPRLGVAPLARADAELRAHTYKMIAHPTRLQILSVIMGSPDEQATVGQVAEALGLRQPTITHHVAMMAEDGLVLREPIGRQVWLSVARDRRTAVADLVR